MFNNPFLWSLASPPPRVTGLTRQVIHDSASKLDGTAFDVAATPLWSFASPTTGDPCVIKLSNKRGSQCIRLWSYVRLYLPPLYMRKLSARQATGNKIGKASRCSFAAVMMHCVFAISCLMSIVLFNSHLYTFTFLCYEASAESLRGVSREKYS